MPIVDKQIPIRDEGSSLALRSYLTNAFGSAATEAQIKLPLGDEAHVDVWREYADLAKQHPATNVLRKVFIQLNFPILRGISTSNAYRKATKQGYLEDDQSGGKLCFSSERALEIKLHTSLAGTIPLIIAYQREDFVSLVQAISKKNEPDHIPDSMAAAMIAGYNNWDRIGRLRLQWEKENVFGQSWKAHFQKLIPQKHLYQDKFMILGNTPYSAIPAGKLGLTETKWRELSLIIRREHESAHYFTRRVLGVMRNNLHDELIADFMGIYAAFGEFRSELFLMFLGLENCPELRSGGRFENYCREHGLNEGDIGQLKQIIHDAAVNLELFVTPIQADLFDERSRVCLVLALASLSLEKIAAEDALERLFDAWETAHNRVMWTKH